MKAAPIGNAVNALSFLVRWSQRTAVALFTSCVAVSASQVWGQVGIGVNPVFPNAVKIGATPPPRGNIVITNKTVTTSRIDGLRITPACGLVPPGSSLCDVNKTEGTLPEVITLGNSGTGSADCRTAADINVVQTTFSINAGPTGQPYTIGPPFLLPGGVGKTCIITFDFTPNRNPTFDSSATLSGFQTIAVASANAADIADPNLRNAGSGTTQLSFPQLTTTPTPSLGDLPSPPLVLSDSAQIVGLVPGAGNTPPNGEVEFRLYPPSDQLCTGAVFRSQVVNVNDPARCSVNGTSYQVNCTSGTPLTVDTTGVWHWTATYLPDANNVQVVSPCASEPVTVGPAQPVLTTTPSAAKFGSAMNDTGQLTLGSGPPFAGSITFNLFDPTQQPNCTGVPRYTQTVPVSAAGAATTSPGFIADQVGTWQWSASYSGDANNKPATSGCGQEPVNVPPPVLTIVKSPKGSTYVAGSPISFNILVTNTGPGTATKVRFAPADILPDPNRSLSWSISVQPAGNPCTVTPSGPALQLLNCNFGDLLEGASVAVTVTSQTQANDPGDCGTPLTLTNNASVIADNAGQKTDTGSLVCQGPTSLTTTPMPATGKVGGPALNDSAVLGGGPPPWAGAITFNLFDSTQTGCIGTPRFTQVVPVTAGGTAASTGGPIPDKTGKWQWTATYSGDATHAAATSGCGAEPVDISPPVITIQKGPKGTTYKPGDPLTFTIVVTNLGPGTATAVAFAPADLLPDPNKSLNWSLNPTPAGATCSVSGAIGSQVLNCAFGDMLEGTSYTVSATTATQANDPGDCPTNALTNTATVISTNAAPKTDTGSLMCVGPPVLKIVKTPDGGAYLPGDPITFSMVVSNTGAARADNVRFSPADALPDPNGSLNWSVTQQPVGGNCTIAGAIGAQLLNCSFGNLDPNATATVKVTTMLLPQPIPAA